MTVADWVALLVLIIGVVALGIERFRSSREARGHHNGRLKAVLLTVGIAALLVQSLNEQLGKWEHRRDQEQLLAELQSTRRDQERLLAALKITQLEQEEHRREQNKLIAAVNALEAKGLLTREEARALMRPAQATEVRVSTAPPSVPLPPPTEVPVPHVRVFATSSAQPVPAAPTNLTVR